MDAGAFTFLARRLAAFLRAAKAPARFGPGLADAREAGTAQAQVAWSSGRFFGCKFSDPISTAAVSAAMLRSPGPDQPQQNRETVEKALIELESLSFAIKRITRVVDKAIDQLTKK